QASAPTAPMRDTPIRHHPRLRRAAFWLSQENKHSEPSLAGESCARTLSEARSCNYWTLVQPSNRSRPRPHPRNPKSDDRNPKQIRKPNPNSESTLRTDANLI